MGADLQGAQRPRVPQYFAEQQALIPQSRSLAKEKEEREAAKLELEDLTHTSGDCWVSGAKLKE